MPLRRRGISNVDGLGFRNAEFTWRVAWDGAAGKRGRTPALELSHERR